MTWLTCGAAGSLGPFEQAEVALAILQRLTDAQAAVDAQGQPLLPLPVAHRHIASLRCLPHIVQVRRHRMHAVPSNPVSACHPGGPAQVFAKPLNTSKNMSR